MAQPKNAKGPSKEPSDKDTGEDKPNRKVRYEVQPEFWDSVFDSLPPWLDEISAFALLIFGVISFAAVFDVASDALLADAWSNALESLFGYGSIIISGGIFALGVVILLPKIGVNISFPARRILALEVAFFSLLPIFHLWSGDSELRAIARAGEGGGYIGYALSWIPVWAFGTTITLILFFLIFALSMGMVIGIRRTHVTQTLQRMIDELTNAAVQIEPPHIEQRPRNKRDTAPFTGDHRFPHGVLMRIRPPLESLPPSQRPGAVTSSDISVIQNPDIEDEDHERLARIAAKEITASKSDQSDEEFLAMIGTVKGRSKPQPTVERPDGRIKRYFIVERMKEAKKVGRRDKNLPDLDLLEDAEMTPPDEREINRNVVLIENTLLEFDIDIDIVDVKVGPTVTQYAVQPYAGSSKKDEGSSKHRTRLSKIASLSNDIALALSAKRLRLETPVPGQSYMGIEVPNRNPSVVTLRSVYESKTFYEMLQKAKSPLTIPLGRDVAGNAIGVDLATMPHLLIAGTTGSGKSVAIAAIATALILNNAPDTVKMVMLDPKMVELSRFNGLPHLLGPVETDIERIIGVLRWCTREMDRRYKLLEENAARNIDIYNSRLGQRRKSEHLPYIVVMVDEVGDLMMNKPEETEKTITRLAQMARAVGIHLIVATQRPSVDVITGLIKANFPTRISFAVASGIDSRVILDAVGAETLLGRGDMLYLAQDAAGPRRVQGCFVGDDEVRAVVDYWKTWYQERRAEGRIERLGVAPWERGLTRREFLAETDPMLEDAIDLVIEEQEASASLIQRKLGLGYPRAARMIDLLEELGIIGESVAGGRSRKVLIEKGKDPFQEIIERKTKE